MPELSAPVLFPVVIPLFTSLRIVAVAGVLPHVVGTQYRQFDDGGTLVAEGPVSRPTGVVAVVGGLGAFSGAGGELTGVAIGTNSTGFPNLRITFRLEKQAPK